MQVKPEEKAKKTAIISKNDANHAILWENWGQHGIMTVLREGRLLIKRDPQQRAAVFVYASGAGKTEKGRACSFCVRLSKSEENAIRNV